MKSLNNDLPVRIVRKNKKHHAAHHGGAWKVAYADFVTAMMALFIVLWIVGQSKQIKEYVANYFKDPGAFFENTKGTGTFSGDSPIVKERIQDEMLKREEKKLEEMANAIMRELTKEPNLKKLLEQIKIEIVKEGMRIELLEGSESFFFDIGNAQLKPEAIKILSAIAKEVGKLPNHIIIEGHTDSRPYQRSDGYSNFELSADRSNSARRVLVANGIKDSQIDEVRGYADRKLRNAENPNDVSNRRISIIIKFDVR